jgi:hypothetical protein
VYTHVFARRCAARICFGAMIAAAVAAKAQGRVSDPIAAAPVAQPESPPQQDMSQHDMHTMGTTEAAMPPSRDGSGTSWLPDETPMYAVHATAGKWTLMGHGNAFVQYLRESGRRGDHQAGSINWAMGMADRPAGRGHLQLRAMLSLEPLTILGCGYPDLLASGEVCKGESIHDRQHPHDLFMELAAEYDRPVRGAVRLQVYGGPAGEPALGPVAFPHRLSAMPNALAPITHHWLDATHITYGVLTGGVYGRRWKAETSMFNGREPDDRRTNVEVRALDSWSGRLWILPTARWALQVSAGTLTDGEAGHDGGPRIDVHRVTASATYHRPITTGGFWASTVGWGRNAEAGNEATHAFLAESTVALNERDAWFGRFELAQKSGHDLALELRDTVGLAKLQGGYTRYGVDWKGLKPGFGAALSTGIVPTALRPSYGSRVNLGINVFMTLRPSAQGM